MKKIIFLIIICFYFNKFCKSRYLNISLKDYLDGKNLEKGKTQIYLLKDVVQFMHMHLV
jgi:hypothetical protein